MHRNPGLVVNQDTLPTTDELNALGLQDDWIRCLVVDVDAFDQAVTAAAWPDTVKICALLEGQTHGVGGNFEGWDQAVAGFANRFRGRVTAVECGNELDIWFSQPPVGQPNRLLTPEFAADLVRRAAPPLRDAGIAVIAPAVASAQWQSYLGAMSAALGDAADFQAFHPYGKKIDNHPPNSGWGELRTAIDEARRLAGRPLALTEVGVTLEDAGGPAGQAEYVRRLFDLMGQLEPGTVEMFCYFSIMDRVGHGGDGRFGLVEEDGRWRDACHVFQRGCLGSRLPPTARHRGEPRFDFGFARWATLEPDLLGNPLEDELHPAEGLAVQRTSRGLLVWSASDGGAFLFDEAESGQRRFWRESWNASLPVMTA